MILLYSVITAACFPKMIQIIIRRKEASRKKKYVLNQAYSSIDFLIDGGLLFLIFYQTLNHQKVSTSVFSIFYYTLIVLTIRIDVMYRIIPNECVLLLSLVHLFDAIKGHFFLETASSVLLMLVILLASIRISKSFFGLTGIGAGDVKLLLAIALACSFWELQYYLFVLAVVLLLYVLWSVVIRKRTMFDSFAMGPHLLIAFIIFSLYIKGGI